MKTTRLIFCGLLLTVAGCDNNNQTTNNETAQESTPTTEISSIPSENNQLAISIEKSEKDLENQSIEETPKSATTEELKVDVPAEPVEEKLESTPVEAAEELKIDVPIESTEEKSESVPVEIEESKVDVPAEVVEEKQDVSQGKQLHDENCISCHTTRTKNADPNTLYTRENRKVNNLNGLQAQVERCVTVLNVEWFDDEIDSVVNYLNTDFYKFRSKTDN